MPYRLQTSSRAALFPLLLAGLPCDAAVPGAWERFPIQWNANAWTFFDAADGLFYPVEWVNPPNGDPHIRAIHLGDAPLTFVAGPAVGSGALVGDYHAANVRAVACEVFIEDLTEFEAVECSVSADGPAGRRIYHSRPLPAALFSGNGWHQVEFDFGEDWFYQNDDGWQPVTVNAAFLTTIGDVGITFLPLPGSLANSLAAIDNVILAPHVTAPPLALLTGETTFRITFAPARGLCHHAADVIPLK